MEATIVFWRYVILASMFFPISLYNPYIYPIKVSMLFSIILVMKISCCSILEARRSHRAKLPSAIAGLQRRR